MLDSLLPSREISRRGFVVTTLAAGFAAAALPVHARTVIVTDSDGLVAGEVRIPTHDGQIPAYRAMPSGRSGLGTILVVQEIFGVHEHIRDVCRRLAKAGFLAVSPELYARQADVSKMSVGDIVGKVLPHVADSQVMADLDATAAWAAAHGGDADRLGITGFCWGGRIVWIYAAHSARLKAGVAWYGPLANAFHAGDRTAIDAAPTIRQPILGLYGASDRGIPNDAVERMRVALKAAGNAASEIVLYPDTPHGFHADYRASYRRDAAEDAWKRAVAWFGTYGVG